MKHNAKTLIILSHGFPKDESDTTCLTSQQIFVKKLNENFPSLKIIILSFQYPFSTAAYSWHDNIVIPFNGLKNGVVARVLLWRRLWATLKTLKKDNDIIGLLSFWCGECAFIGKWFAKRNNLKHFTWITGQDARRGNKYIPLIRPQSQDLIAMSDFLADEFYKNYAVKPLHVIPNGIDVTLFSRQNPERDIAILGAGSLIPLKQYDVFINVVKKILKKKPDANATLCGKGPQEMELQKLIAQLMLQNKIILTGEISHQKILRLMQRAKIFLHTSNYEGFSTVCLEALYAGCDVISFVRPMHDDIDHWHIVNTEEEMVKKAIELLVLVRDNTPVLPYVMDDSAKAIMQLFNYKEAATS